MIVKSKSMVVIYLTAFQGTLYFVFSFFEGNTPFKLHVIGEMFQANLF